MKRLILALSVIVMVYRLLRREPMYPMRLRCDAGMETEKDMWLD